MRITLARLTSASLGLLLSAGLAQAGEPLVLAFNDLPPWKTQENGKFVGAHTEIIRELARRTGHALRIEPCPLQRCLYMLGHGQADIAIGLQPSPERERYLHFLHTPYRAHGSDKVFYVAKNSGVRIAGYADLAPLRIGVKLGADYFPRFDADTALHKDTVADMALNFYKLNAGRLDTVVIAEDQGAAYLARLNLSDRIEKANYRVGDGAPRAVAIARNAPHIRDVAPFERAMSDMVRDGTLARLFRRYYYDALHIPYDAVQIN